MTSELYVAKIYAALLQEAENAEGDRQELLLEASYLISILADFYHEQMREVKEEKASDTTEAKKTCIFIYTMVQLKR